MRGIMTDRQLDAPGLVAYIVATTLWLLCSGGMPAAKGLTTFNFVNNCEYTVWPGVLSNAGSELLADGGFELGPGQSASVEAPAGWSGRFWGRTGCNFGEEGATPSAACASGDCGGRLECAGAGAAPPATLAEFTLAGSTGSRQDFYDVSLVDGYNLALSITPTTSAVSAAVSTAGASTATMSCGVAGCNADLNLACPASLQLLDESRSSVVGCKSACDAFGSAQYCCAGAYANPSTCRPSSYSQLFKSACPKAYSYAYDDPTSTFTCATASHYTIAFCPTSSSQKTVTGLQPGNSVLGSQAYASQSAAQPPKRLPSYLSLLGLAICMAPFLRLRYPF